MSTRLERKHRTPQELGIKGSGGLFDLMDNSIKQFYRINDEEYDHIAESLTPEEIEVFMNSTPTFAESRQKIHILNKYLT